MGLWPQRHPGNLSGWIPGPSRPRLGTKRAPGWCPALCLQGTPGCAEQPHPCHSQTRASAAGRAWRDPGRSREGSPGKQGISCEGPRFRGGVQRFGAQRPGFGCGLPPPHRPHPEKPPQQSLNCSEPQSSCSWTGHVSQVCQWSRLHNKLPQNSTNRH